MHINSGSHDNMVYIINLRTHFCKYADNLLAMDYDVVRPFDLRAEPGHLRNSFHGRHAFDQRQHGSVSRIDFWLQQDREKQSCPNRGTPCPSSSSTAGCLLICHNYRPMPAIIARFFCNPFGLHIRGVQLIVITDVMPQPFCVQPAGNFAL